MGAKITKKYDVPTAAHRRADRHEKVTVQDTSPDPGQHLARILTLVSRWDQNSSQSDVVTRAAEDHASS